MGRVEELEGKQPWMKPGVPVRIISGQYRGCEAILDSEPHRNGGCSQYLVRIVITKGLAKKDTVKRIFAHRVHKLGFDNNPNIAFIWKKIMKK